VDTKREQATIRTVCTLHDGLGCGLSVQTTNGVITKVGPANFPDRVDRGACAKGLATPQLVYHPDRLRHPLKRVGERGEGKWQRISWEQALDSISAKLRDLSQRYGSTSIAWLSALPNVQGANYLRLGSLTKATLVDMWGFGDAAGPCADLATFGWWLGDAYISLIEDPRFSIVWGNNPAVTHYRLMRRIIADKKKGCHLIVIDPRLTSTASRADEYIQIRPGTDVALALAMIHAIIEQGLQDERFIIENTVGPLLVRSDNGLLLRESDLSQGSTEQGFMILDKNSRQALPCDTPGVKPALTGRHLVAGIECAPAYQLLADMVGEYTPERASEITDVSPHLIRNLAIGYATHKPACIYRGMGMQRSFYGDLAWRAINTLAAITGNINLKRPSSFVLNTRTVFMPAGPCNHIPILMLYDAIAKGEPLAIKGMWCAGHNFVNQMPNTNRIVNELFAGLEFIVVSDIFMTATAKYADYVLPACSFYECSDVHITSAQNIYLQLQQKVIEPLYECKPDFQIAAELGRRMGFAEYFDKGEEACIEELLASGHPTMEGITLEKLREGAVQAKPLPRPKEFRTPTGRIEFYVERLKEFEQELPIYFEAVESARSERANAYPLSLLTTHPRQRLHSAMANIPSLLRLDPEPTLTINPLDAKPRSIHNGDVVRVFNDRGQLKVKAKLSQRIKPGVVDIGQGWWPEQYIEGHHNHLTHEMINPAQQFIREPNAALYDVLVEVQRTR
jgi:anaerobic dimethyl sulfoxide reductase subunit A